MKPLTQEERTHQTRSKLKESALRSFAKKGVNSTAIGEIANGAGYSKGAFYGNYSSKLELLLDALEEKQLQEIRMWRSVMETITDPVEGIEFLSKRYVDPEQMLERSLLSSELQLEADRNPDYQPVFKKYLDELYAEMSALITAMLARNDKAPPADMDTIIVTVRLLGMGLGSASILGNEIAKRTTPSEIMVKFLQGLIAAAPELKNTSPTTQIPTR